MTSLSGNIGVNRGYLFGIGHAPHKDYVYVTDPDYPLDPFTNPRLCEVFDNSQVIVSDFENAPKEQEISEFLETLPNRLEESLSAADLQKLKESLAPILEQIPGLKQCQAYKKLKAYLETGINDAAVVTALALFGIQQSITYKRRQMEDLSSQRPLPSNTVKERLQERSALQSKCIIPLSNQADRPKVTEVFSLLMQEPKLFRAILFGLTQPEVITLISNTNAFERGSYDEDQYGIPDMTKQKILRAILSKRDIDPVKLMTSPVLARLGSLLSIPRVSEKIEHFVLCNKRHLFFVSHHTFEEWPRYLFPLTQIITPLKPVGFVWTISDDSGHEGILMGSMHITGQKLINFPNRILRLFDKSDAVAVEIDVKREDIVKRRGEVSWERTQAKELELLSKAEKETLLRHLKELHPDLVVKPTGDLDQQTIFLIKALKQIVLQDYKTNISNKKDKYTNQSLTSTGIEKALIKRAKEKQIPIKDLETFEDHFINFSSGSSSYLPCIPYSHLKKMIERSKMTIEEALDICSSTSAMPKTRDELFEWLQKDKLQKMTDTMDSGDLDALEVSYLADHDVVSKANLIQRNRNMAMKIDEFMRSGKKHFCIAGAMHMAGPSSIVAILKQAGYTVERLIVEEPLFPALDDDEKAPPKNESSRSMIAMEAEQSIDSVDPTNPPVVSLGSQAPQTPSFWQTLHDQALSILSWPWRRFQNI